MRNIDSELNSRNAEEDPVALRQKAYEILKQLGPVECEEPQELQKSFRYLSSYQNNALPPPVQHNKHRVEIDPRPARMAPGAYERRNDDTTGLAGYFISCVADACVRTPGAVAYMVYSTTSSASPFSKPASYESIDAKVNIPSTYRPGHRYRDEPEEEESHHPHPYSFASKKSNRTKSTPPQAIGDYTLEC